ncbi:MAG: hypothetical protein CMJ18_07200 [Phycisphaeraceae bacterium]|nr:hypothetical protein [Phycisphaeraceae bacterium]
MDRLPAADPAAARPHPRPRFDLIPLVFTVLGAWSLSVAPLVPCAAAGVAAAPNIVRIVVDDQNWYGTSVSMRPGTYRGSSDYFQTPNLETLANEGMRFSSAYVSPLCRPTHMAMVTGKSWAQQQITTNLNLSQNYGRPLVPPRVRNDDKSNVSVAQRIKEANPNYATAHFGKYGVSGTLGNWGYDVFSDARTLPAAQDPKRMFSFATQANDFIQQSFDDSKPFYVEFHHNAVKLPAVALPETIDRYNAMPRGNLHREHEFGAMTDDLDSSVGMVLQKLEDLGIDDNTYVIYTSDNGGRWLSSPWGNPTRAPIFGGKGALWEGGIRAPMIIKGPGIEPGAVSDVPIIAMDLFPTITEWAGATAPLHDGIEGASLVPVLENGGLLPAGTTSLQRQHAENGELFFHFLDPGSNPGKMGSAVIDDGYKFMQIYGEPGGSSVSSDLAGATASWTAPAGASGSHEVYVWWSSETDDGQRVPLDASAAYEVRHAGGTSTFVVDQNSGGGDWHLLGTFDLSGDGTDAVVLTASGATDQPANADAVRFVETTAAASEGIVDNQDAGFASDGSWTLPDTVDDFAVPGRREKHYLFHIAQFIRENNQLSHPRNLIDEMPLKAAALQAKLGDWLEAVDASMPYVVSDRVELSWSAEHLGRQEDVELDIVRASLGTSRPRADLNSDGIVDQEDEAIVMARLPKTWRSIHDVDYKDRELWTLGEGEARPQHAEVDPHQPHLPRQAFRFDGDDVMDRNFFHVGDPTGDPDLDNDHSASFEFWLRLEDLDRPHLLFESGDQFRGVSLTVGDADGDGRHDEIRWRVANFSRSVTVTGELDEFADPTRDFVQVVAVFSDDAADRFAELYVNGALFGRVDGISGAGEYIKWDHNPDATAGLGGAGGQVGGSSSAAHEAPLSGVGMAGEIGWFRFLNHVIGASQIEDAYNARLERPDSGIVSVSGMAQVPTDRPSDVSAGSFEADDALIVTLERHDDLDADLAVDLVPEAGRTYADAASVQGGQLAAGTGFSSYLVHFDPEGAPGSAVEVEGTVRFEMPIVAIQIDEVKLDASDPLLGVIGRYARGGRGFDLTGPGRLTVSEDLRSLSITGAVAGAGTMQFRVMTGQVPEPSAAWWLALLGVRRRRVVFAMGRSN